MIPDRRAVATIVPAMKDRLCSELFGYGICLLRVVRRGVSTTRLAMLWLSQVAITVFDCAAR